MKLLYEATWNKRFGIIYAFPSEIRSFLENDSTIKIVTKVLSTDGEDATIHTQFFLEEGEMTTGVMARSVRRRLDETLKTIISSEFTDTHKLKELWAVMSDMQLWMQDIEQKLDHEKNPNT